MSARRRPRSYPVPGGGTSSYAPAYPTRRDDGPRADRADRADRKEFEIRRMLEAPHPSVPPDLAERAMARGRRIVRRRHVRQTAGWVLLVAAAVAGLIAAISYWRTTSSVEVTPPFGG